MLIFFDLPLSRLPFVLREIWLGVSSGIGAGAAHTDDVEESCAAGLVGSDTLVVVDGPSCRPALSQNPSP